MSKRAELADLFEHACVHLTYWDKGQAANATERLLTTYERNLIIGALRRGIPDAVGGANEPR